MITLLTIISAVLTVASGREIYFSKSKQSRDVLDCGNIKTPCRTLAHALRIAKNKDTITFLCNQEKNACKFRLRRRIDIFNKDLIIKSSGDNPQTPIFYFETGEVFQLRGGRVKLTFSNITIHLRRSVGNILNGESRVVFKQCSILVKKRRYSLGIPSSLKFIRVNGNAVLKLYLIDSTVVHLKFDRLRILNLMLADDLGRSVDVYIFNSNINGNIVATFKTSGTGRIHVSGTKFNYTTLSIEGTDQATKTWSSIKIIDSEINNGLLNQQLLLKNLKDVRMQNVTLKGSENVNSLRAQSTSSLIISGFKVLTRMAHISNIDHLVIQKASFTRSNLIIQECKTVMLATSDLKDTDVLIQKIQFLQSNDDTYENSELKVLHSRMVIINSGKYTTSYDQLISFTQSTGVIRNAIISHRPLRVLNSKLTIMSSRFSNNTAIEGKGGGAILSQNSTLVINDTVFHNCSAKYFGGCYYSTDKGSTLQINRVKFESYINEIANPSLFGSSIYSTTTVDLNDVDFLLHNITRSPIVFIKEHQETLACDQKISSLGDFKLQCPSDQTVHQEIHFNERNDLCDTNNFDFLTISCVPCNPGFINPLKATSTNRKKDVTFINNKCTSCANETYVETYRNQTGYEVNCPLVVNIVPAAATPSHKCANNHTMIYDPQCPYGFHFSIFSNECLHHRLFNTYHAFIFWCCLMVIGSLYAVILMYIKEIVVMLRIKHVFLQLKIVFEYCCCCCGCSDEDDGFRLQESPDIIDDEFDLVILKPDQVQIMPLRFTMGTTLGIIKILFFFYQVESLIRVPCPFKEDVEITVLSIIRDSISTIMSLRLQYFVKGLHLIPEKNFTENGKEIIKATFGLWLLIPVLLILIGALMGYINKKCQPRDRYQISEGSMSREDSVVSDDEETVEDNNNKLPQNEISKDIPQTIREGEILEIPIPKLKVQPMKRRFDRIDGKVPIYVEKPLAFRVKCFLLLLLTLVYLPIATLILKSIDCTENTKGLNVLTTQQDIQCYQGVQIFAMILIALWVIPFPLAVYFASIMQYTCKINPRELFISLLCPPSLIFFYARGKLSKYRRTINKEDAMMAKHLLMTLYESFRLQKRDRRFDVMWDVSYLARKLVLMVLIVFSPNGIRLYLVAAFLVFCILLQIKIKPFSRDLTNRLEFLSLVTLCFLTVANIFWEKQNTCVDQTMLSIFQVFFVYAEYSIICAPFLIAIFSVPLAYLLAFICMFRDRHSEEGGEERQSLRSAPSDEKDWQYPNEEEKADGNGAVEKSRKTSTVSATGLVFNEDGHWVGTQETGLERSGENLIISPRREARLSDDEALLGNEGNGSGLDDEKDTLIFNDIGHSTV
ncbi:uncharacterized protein [Clytia hemisphaerica]|uniref:Uncharacterized protein n=1 Tax=Clytia hemisphaerica TaxID=252671 RepID=A0A7M5WUW5_9CNID